MLVARTLRPILTHATKIRAGKDRIQPHRAMHVQIKKYKSRTFIKVFWSARNLLNVDAAASLAHRICWYTAGCRYSACTGRAAASTDADWPAVTAAAAPCLNTRTNIIICDPLLNRCQASRCASLQLGLRVRICEKDDSCAGAQVSTVVLILVQHAGAKVAQTQCFSPVNRYQRAPCLHFSWSAYLPFAPTTVCCLTLFPELHNATRNFRSIKTHKPKLKMHSYLFKKSTATLAGE